MLSDQCKKEHLVSSHFCSLQEYCLVHNGDAYIYIEEMIEVMLGRSLAVPMMSRVRSFTRGMGSSLVRIVVHIIQE